MAEPDYFTLDEFRELPDCSGSTFSDDQINAASAFFVEIVEREVGRPFIPRTYTETLDGRGTDSLVLGQPFVRSLTSVTLGGSTVDVSGLVFNGGVLRYASSGTYTGQSWTVGAGNAVVTYVAGEYAEPPADIKDAVMWATRDRLISQSEESGSWDRKSSVNTEMGTVNYVLPGEKRPTGYPELDALIASYVRNTASFGFA